MKKQEVSEAEQFGYDMGNKFFGFLEKIVGKTGAQIIALAILLYVFRDFFIGLFEAFTK